MKTKTEESIVINLIRKEGEAPATFDIPACAKCTNACKKCRLNFMLNLETEDKLQETSITVGLN